MAEQLHDDPGYVVPMEYRISVSPVDTWAAYACEADRADREGMVHTAERQRKTGLHLKNAVAHLVEFCPEGMRVETELVVRHVPDVNPVLREDLQTPAERIKAKIGEAEPA